MKNLSYLVAAFLSLHPSTTLAGTCDPYQDVTERVVNLYSGDPFLMALDVQMEIQMGTDRTEGHLASSIKENHDHHWFSGKDKVVIAIGKEMCDLALSEDAFAIAACHEVGHAIGGPPYYGGSAMKIDFEAMKKSASLRDNIAASEGQADYWATSHCMPSLLENEDNLSWITQHPADPKFKFVIKDCDATYGANTQASARCLRIAMASTELIHSMQKYGYQRAMEAGRLSKKLRDAGPYLPQPDEFMPARKAGSETAGTLYNRYPSPQCRLDTYIAGALCPIDFHLPIDHDSMKVNTKEAMKQGACLVEGANPKGARPACWFNEARSIYGKPTIPGL